MNIKWTNSDYRVSPSEATLLAKLCYAHEGPYTTGDCLKQANGASAIADDILADAASLAAHKSDAPVSEPVVTVTEVQVPTREVAQVLAAGLSSVSGKIFQYRERNDAKLTVAIEPRANGTANSKATPDQRGSDR